MVPCFSLPCPLSFHSRNNFECIFFRFFWKPLLYLSTYLFDCWLTAWLTLYIYGDFLPRPSRATSTSWGELTRASSYHVYMLMPDLTKELEFSSLSAPLSEPLCTSDNRSMCMWHACFWLWQIGTRPSSHQPLPPPPPHHLACPSQAWVW